MRYGLLRPIRVSRVHVAKFHPKAISWNQFAMAATRDSCCQVFALFIGLFAFITEIERMEGVEFDRFHSLVILREYVSVVVY